MNTNVRTLSTQLYSCMYGTYDFVHDFYDSLKKAL